jgi:hypothetical protein
MNVRRRQAQLFDVDRGHPAGVRDLDVDADIDNAAVSVVDFDVRAEEALAMQNFA